jgi:hypothetical protein
MGIKKPNEDVEGLAQGMTQILLDHWINRPRFKKEPEPKPTIRRKMQI